MIDTLWFGKRCEPSDSNWMSLKLDKLKVIHPKDAIKWLRTKDKEKNLEDNFLKWHIT